MIKQQQSRKRVIEMALKLGIKTFQGVNLEKTNQNYLTQEFFSDLINEIVRRERQKNIQTLKKIPKNKN